MTTEEFLLAFRRNIPLLMTMMRSRTKEQFEQFASELRPHLQLFQEDLDEAWDHVSFLTNLEPDQFAEMLTCLDPGRKHPSVYWVDKLRTAYTRVWQPDSPIKSVRKLSYFDGVVSRDSFAVGMKPIEGESEAGPFCMRLRFELVTYEDDTQALLYILFIGMYELDVVNVKEIIAKLKAGERRDTPFHSAYQTKAGAQIEFVIAKYSAGAGINDGVIGAEFVNTHKPYLESFEWGIDDFWVEGFTTT